MWGGDPLNPPFLTLSKPFQLTPPCGGATIVELACIRAEIVSTHAPVWGGDSTPTYRSEPDTSFNSRPRVGGRRRIPPVRHIIQSFNSRPRVGGRQVLCVRDYNGFKFQLTPPCGGATCRVTWPRPLSTCFNSRPRVGGRLYSLSRTISPFLFQLTPPCGGATCFNALVERIKAVSTHAPVWGGDCQYTESSPMEAAFQLTPPCGGATLVNLANTQHIHSFNSRPRVGGRPGRRTSRYKPCRFNSRPRVGGRLQGDEHAPRVALFQLTPPCGGATAPF